LSLYHRVDELLYLIIALLNSALENGCYDFSCELRLHLDKDLRRDKRCIKVVKHKEYRSISTLYIYNKHERIVHSTCVKQVIEQWGLSKDRAPTTWGADWDYFGIANHIIITLYPSPYCI